MINDNDNPGQENRSSQAQVQELLDHIQSLLSENRFLKHRVEELERRLFGRKSEKIDPNQLRLVLDEEAVAIAAEEVPIPKHADEAPDYEEVPAHARRKRHSQHRGRAPIPSHLPRHREEIHPEGKQRKCPCCQAELKPIGEEVTEELGRQQAKLFVRQLVRVKYACPECQETVVRPPLPPRPIEKGRAGPDVLADVCVSKFADHLPLHRLQVMYRREGLELPRSTLCDWVAECSWLLQPIAEQMRQEVLAGGVIQSDDTRLRYQDPERGRQCRNGYLWVYVGDQQDVVYDFTRNRSRDGPLRFLGNFEGVLQVDGYAGYNAVLERPGIRHQGCWAHVRRKFVEARDTAPKEAALVLLLIRALYAVEAEAKKQELKPKALLKLRQERSVEILADLQGHVTLLFNQTLPKSPLGRALAYTIELWEALYYYTGDGRVAIDNNSAERAMRRVAVGRKNWLFAGSPAGGERAAVLYSLIETCSRHGINPHAYLTDVLQRVCTHPAKRVAELTPRAWQSERGKPESAAASA
jgi:transposase